MLDNDEVVLGLGVYDQGLQTRFAGFSVPELFEYDGHLWQPYSLQPSEPGDRSLRMASDGDPDRPVLSLPTDSVGMRVLGDVPGDAILMIVLFERFD